jgi:DNA-binding MarR family transcriptional regulator
MAKVISAPAKARASANNYERRLPILLRRAWFGLNQAFRRQIADTGMTPGQFTVLRTLTERGDLTQRELTEIMSSDANTIASVLSRLEKLGWITRETHERDRRANRMHLTAIGKLKFETARPVALALQKQILSALPDRERERFLKSLERVAAASQAALEASECATD